MAETQKNYEQQPIDRLKNELYKLFEAWVGEAKGKIGRGVDKAEKEFLFYLESKAITEFYKELENFKKYILETYPGQVWKKRLWYPRKWMLDDTQISKLLGRDRIADVLNALEEKQRLFSPEGVQYKNKTKNATGKRSKSYSYACFITNADFYKKILPELKMAKITLQKYLTALYKVGALVRLDKTGAYEKKNEILYAVGYYSEYNGRPKLNRFLTKTKAIPLRGFKI